MELIFKTFEDPMILSKIKIPKCTLYIGIDVKKDAVFKNTIFKMHK